MSTLPAIHKMNGKTNEDIEKIAQRYASSHSQRRPSPDDLVARLHFGFWEILIKNLDHESHPNNLQYEILSSCFPNAPLANNSDFGTPLFKNQVVSLMNRIRDIRNRIGHHEPIWRVGEFDANGTVGFLPPD
jgi:hypothetical protein